MITEKVLEHKDEQFTNRLLVCVSSSLLCSSVMSSNVLTVSSPALPSSDICDNLWLLH